MTDDDIDPRPTPDEAMMLAEGEAIARLVDALHCGGPLPIGHISLATGVAPGRVLAIAETLRALPAPRTPWWWQRRQPVVKRRRRVRRHP